MAWCDASSSRSDDVDGEVGDDDNDDGGDDDDDDDEDGSKVIYVQHAKYFISTPLMSKAAFEHTHTSAVNAT